MKLPLFYLSFISVLFYVVRAAQVGLVPNWNPAGKKCRAVSDFTVITSAAAAAAADDDDDDDAVCLSVTERRRRCRQVNWSDEAQK